MFYDIYYVNSAGTKIDLCKWPYMVYDGEILDYEYAYESTSNYGRSGGKITRFTRNIEARSLKISIFGKSEIVYRKAVDTLADAIEYDVSNHSPGKLYINGSYIECYIKGLKVDDWVLPLNQIDAELSFVVEYPFWLMERKYSFRKTEGTSTGDIKYPMRFPYRYPNGQTNGQILQRHFKPCDFILTIEGPAVNPSVEINDKIYGIKGQLTAQEYVVIDTRLGFVRKYSKNIDGYTNLFDDRTRDNDIYEPLSKGALPVNWTGEFSFSVLVIEERSFPRWSS